MHKAGKNHDFFEKIEKIDQTKKKSRFFYLINVNKSGAKVLGYSIGRLKYHYTTIVEIILLTLMARLQSLSLTFLLKNASVMKPIFFNMCPSLEAQQLKVKLLGVKTKTKPCDLCELGINRLLVI